MSLARAILSNTAWQILGKALTAILGIMSIKLITNYLTPAMYGQYTGIYDYAALFAIIADFGLFTIAVREMGYSDGSREKISYIAGNVLTIRTLLALVAFGIGIVSAFLIPAYRDTRIPMGVTIVSLATIFTLISGTMWSVLQFRLRMQWASIAIIIGKIITVGYIAVSIFYLFPKNAEVGFFHLLFAWIIGGLFTITISYFSARKVADIRFQIDTKFWKEVLIKALPYGFALVLGTIYFRMGTLMLLFFKLETDAGKYGVALRFLEILQLVPHYFMGSVLPTLANRLKEDFSSPTKPAATRIVRYCINVMGALAIPILVGGMLLSWHLAAAVSSPEFLSHRTTDGVFIYGSDNALFIILIAMTCTYLHVVLNYTLVALGRQREILKINALAVVINIVINVFIIPHYGFVGAAITAVATEISMLIGLNIMTRKYLRDMYDFSFLTKSIFSALIMGGFIWLVRDSVTQKFGSAGLLILIPLGIIIFASMMIGTRALSKEMLRHLKKDADGETAIVP